MRKEKNTQDCLGTGLEAMGFENLLGIFLILIFLLKSVGVNSIHFLLTKTSHEKAKLI